MHPLPKTIRESLNFDYMQPEPISALDRIEQYNKNWKLDPETEQQVREIRSEILPNYQSGPQPPFTKPPLLPDAVPGGAPQNAFQLYRNVAANPPYAYGQAAQPSYYQQPPPLQSSAA